MTLPKVQRYTLDADSEDVVGAFMAEHTDGEYVRHSDFLAALQSREELYAGVIEAANKLSFAAQITGGTAGRDDSLVAAIDAYAIALSRLSEEEK